MLADNNLPSSSKLPASRLTDIQYAILKVLHPHPGLNAETIGDMVAERLDRIINHADIRAALSFLAKHHYIYHNEGIHNLAHESFHILQKGGQHVFSYDWPSNRDMIVFEMDFGCEDPYIRFGDITVFWKRYDKVGSPSFSFTSIYPSNNKIRWWRDWHITRRYDS